MTPSLSLLSADDLVREAAFWFITFENFSTAKKSTTDYSTWELAPTHIAILSRGKVVALMVFVEFKTLISSSR